MDKTKYIGMDVHKEAISIAVLDSTGKLVMQSVIETKAATIGRGPETWSDEIATPDSLYRSDSGGCVDRADSDTSSFSHEATTVDLQRSGDRNT